MKDDLLYKQTVCSYGIPSAVAMSVNLSKHAYIQDKKIVQRFVLVLISRMLIF